MYPNFMVLCITIGVVGVLGGCVKDRFLMDGHFPDKKTLLEDVELIDGELKLKLDHKIEEKELLEKTLAALKSYFLHEHETLGKETIYSSEKIYVPAVESHKDGKHEITLKILKRLLGSDLKVEELTEKDLVGFEIILKCLFERMKSKESPDEILKFKTEDSSVKHSAKMSELLPEESKDFKTYLAESILHAGITKNADGHHGIEGAEDLLKKLKEAPEEISHILMDDKMKEYFKSLTDGKVGEEEILHSLAGSDDEIFKKLSKILKDGVSHEEGSFKFSSELAKEFDLEKSLEAAKASNHKAFQKEEVLNHGKDHDFDEILKKEEVHALDEGFEDKKFLSAGKAFEHVNKEKTLNHAKDDIYDDILKKKEVHSLDKGFEEEKFLGSGKAKEEHGSIYKEKAVDHIKDHIYDDILSKEEIHSLGKDFEEEKFHDAAKSFEDHLIEKGIHMSGEKAFGIGATVEESKSKEVIAKAKESGARKLTKDEEIAKAGKDISIEDILKEDGYYITRGTHAYEAARDKAHEDASITLTEDSEKAIDSSIAHGKEVFHKVSEKGVNFAKGKEAALPGIKGKEGILKEKVHDIDTGLEEGHIKHDIKTEESHLIHGIPEEHHHTTGHNIDETPTKETHHSKAHQIKQKLLGILGKFLPIKKCHLVTMPPRELLGIIDCISRSKDPLLCEKFAMCEKKMPLQVILALEKCQKETIPGGAKRCSKYEPLYPSPEIPIKIFKCIVKNTHELTSPEKKMMIDFEECARQVKIESCGRIPWG